jgi:hypothetical protein
MSLLDYAAVRPWAKAIRNAVSDRKMPPFHANAPLGHFQNDNRLTDAEVDTVLRWVDAGALRGDPEDAPPPVESPSGDWTLGQPDMIIEFPEYTSKTNNTDEEILLFSDHLFQRAKWVQAIEFHSSDYRIVHHAGIFGANDTFFVPEDRILDSEDEHLEKFGSSNGGIQVLSQNNFYTWLPGQRLEQRPAGQGFRMGKGERIVIQTHIAPTTEPIRFKLSLGLWFVNGELDSRTNVAVSWMTDIRIPPGEPDYEFRERHRIDRDMTVEGFTVHMHLRGESARILFHYPDGRTETVFDMPRYDFNWQRVYTLAEPLQVPANTEFEYIAEWDNSPGNPLNPDPAKEVIWGGKTTDEMFGGNVYFSVKRKVPVQVVKGVEVRPINSEEEATLP